MLGLSDGSQTDSAEAWKIDGRGTPTLEDRQQWTIPRGHPTRELVLISHGERTTRILRKLEQCFGYEPLAHPALPDKTVQVCELLMVRGIVVPDTGRFTARTKVALPEQDGWPYGEFFLNINSETRQIWVSEKSDEYRIPILARFSAAPEATPG